jgi:hypothetical protein
MTPDPNAGGNVTEINRERIYEENENNEEFFGWMSPADSTGPNNIFLLSVRNFF